MNALRKAYEGASMRNSRLRDAYERIAITTYEGNERSFPFSRFIEVLLNNFQIIEDYDRGMSYRHKITHMIKKINVRSTQVDMAIHNIQEQMDRDDEIRFDEAWPRIHTAISGSVDSRSKKAGIASVESGGPMGYRNRKKNKNGKKVSFDDRKVENGVDYSDVNTQFSQEQWKALSDKTKRYIIKGRKIKKSNQKQNKKDGKSKRNIGAIHELKQYLDQKLSNVSLVSSDVPTKGTKGILKRDHIEDDGSEREVFYNEPPKRNKKTRRS